MKRRVGLSVAPSHNAWDVRGSRLGLHTDFTEFFGAITQLLQANARTGSYLHTGYYNSLQNPRLFITHHFVLFEALELQQHS
jgi:hypothetical protein